MAMASEMAEVVEGTLAEHWYNSINHGDCMALMAELPDHCIDLVVTDPPYFLHGLDNAWNLSEINKGFKQARVIANLPAGMRFDRKQADELRRYYTGVSEEILRLLKPGGFFLSFSQPRLSFAMAQAVHDAGFEVRDVYTWYYHNKSQCKAFSHDHFINRMDIPEEEKNKIKRSISGRKTPQLRPQTELIIMGQKPREGTFVENWQKYRTGLIDFNTRLNDAIPSTIMHVPKPNRLSFNKHLTVKPLRLIMYLIELFSSPGQLVLDPFLGSGTSAVAAQRTNRQYVGMEINESYIDITQKRLAEENAVPMPC